jgi:hypothetical protein
VNRSRYRIERPCHYRLRRNYTKSTSPRVAAYAERVFASSAAGAGRPFRLADHASRS